MSGVSVDLSVGAVFTESTDPPLPLPELHPSPKILYDQLVITVVACETDIYV